MQHRWGRSACLRAAAVLVVSSGVLAMHAMNAGHGAGEMPGASEMVATHALGTGAVAGSPTLDTLAGGRGDGDGNHSGRSLALICVAVLTGGLGLVLLLVLFAGAGRIALATLPRKSPDPRPARAPPARPPSLSTLCISRT